jgi:hypothetical protein
VKKHQWIPGEVLAGDGNNVTGTDEASVAVPDRTLGLQAARTEPLVG